MNRYIRWMPEFVHPITKCLLEYTGCWSAYVYPSFCVQAAYNNSLKWARWVLRHIAFHYICSYKRRILSGLNISISSRTQNKSIFANTGIVSLTRGTQYVYKHVYYIHIYIQHVISYIWSGLISIKKIYILKHYFIFYRLPLFVCESFWRLVIKTELRYFQYVSRPNSLLWRSVH